jgi:Uma2 family endonuclease
MAMPAVHTEWTIEMLDALPESSERHEIIDGVLYVTPSPMPPHQLIIGELYAPVREYLQRFPIGRAIMSPSDVWRGERRTNRVQPDLFVFRLIDGKMPPFPFRMHDLLLAVEVVSPGNATLDYQVKRELYLRNGIPEYWAFSPDARNVMRWQGRTEPGEVLSERLVWHPTGATEPLVIDLPALFDRALL